MITSLTTEELREYTSRQLNFFFPDKRKVILGNFKKEVTLALDRLEHCFSYCNLKQYNDQKNTFFDHLYSDHYVMYLWFLANTLWKEKEEKVICNKLYYLNKSLHGFDCMFDTKLPDIFLLFHCSGTMLGNASYADFFITLNGTTVGSHKGQYPVMDKGVSLTAHSSLIGNCVVGRNVSISAYTNVFETEIPANSVVFKNVRGGMVIKSSPKSYAQSFFNVNINESKS